MTTLKRRLVVLEARRGINNDLPIYAYKLESMHWSRIRVNRNIHIVLFHPDHYDTDRLERLADIERLKRNGRHVTVISQSDGWATWKDGVCTEDQGLGYE